MGLVMVKVLVASRIHEKGIGILRENNVDVFVVDEPGEEELAELVKGYDGLIVRSKPLVTRRVIESSDKLVVIARAGVGVDNIDVEAAKSRGIEVITVPEATTTSVAELTIGLMIAVARRISFCDREVRKGVWPKKQAEGFELSGKILGIIGAGRIGSTVARIAKHGLNMQIVYYSSTRKPGLEEELGARYLPLNDLLRTADVVSVHVPLKNETRHMINEEKLRLMKKTAILINTSRGGLIDTNALIKALQEGWIAGAGLDVYEEEPLPKDHPLTRLENVVLTPHVGASTREAQERAGIQVAEKIVQFFRARGLL